MYGGGGGGGGGHDSEVSCDSYLVIEELKCGLRNSKYFHIIL